MVGPEHLLSLHLSVFTLNRLSAYACVSVLETCRVEAVGGPGGGYGVWGVGG